MAYINNLGELKEKSLRVYEGMPILHPYSSQVDYLHLDLTPVHKKPIADCEHRYCIDRNQVMCYVDGQEIWVTSYTPGVEKVLEDSGFISDYFAVPFSNGDIPKLEKV